MLWVQLPAAFAGEKRALGGEGLANASRHRGRLGKNKGFVEEQEPDGGDPDSIGHVVWVLCDASDDATQDRTPAEQVDRHAGKEEVHGAPKKSHDAFVSQ